MRLLDLFCGAGGCSMGYARAGFEVVGIDLAPQKNYPFEFHQADALIAHDPTWISRNFDAIHASPPCQAHSEMHNPSRDQHVDLIPATRALLEATGLPYVIENVEGARKHLVDPVRLCGSGFGLGVRRHRLFEANFEIPLVACDHASQPPKYPVYNHGKHYLARVVPVYGTGGGKAKEHWADAMGIDWMTRPEMAQAIPPSYTEHVGNALRSHLDAG